MSWESEEKMKSGEYARWAKSYNEAADYYGSNDSPYGTAPYALCCPVCGVETRRGDALFNEVERLKNDPPARLCPTCRASRDAYGEAFRRFDRWVTIIAIALAVLLLAGAGALIAWLSSNSPHRIAREKEPLLQGKWALVSYALDGTAAPEHEIKDSFMLIDGASMTFLHKYEQGKGAMTIDPSKSPAHIDFMFETGPNRESTLKGIYKIEGDTLTVCYASNRPTEFVSRAGSGSRLCVAKRAN